MSAYPTKVRWPHVLVAVISAMGGALFVCVVAVTVTEPTPAKPLEAGDMVEHKLMGWDGIVLWNNEGPGVAVRFTRDVDYGGSIIWQDTVEAEWVRK